MAANNQILLATSGSKSSSRETSRVRAWCYLVWLSWQRQARIRQTVWIALGLLIFAVVLVALFTLAGRWNMRTWRFPRYIGPTYEEWQTGLTASLAAAPGPPGATAVEFGVLGAMRAALEQSDFYVFSNVVGFSMFVSFLLPLWSLSFATESFGGDREAGSLVWLLSRPLSRPAIYLAKFAAMLPWSLGLTLGGFALLCLAAGRPGPFAFRLFWPAVLCGSLAFCALFHLIGAFFRRPAVIAIIYSFFLETVLGNMPGSLKRVSISFYTRCMMFQAAQGSGIEPEKPSVYLPVDGATALYVLLAATLVLLLAGMVLFAHSEYVAVE